ncbi:Asp-tRNA(Asn)/Glu-tRNA(Gln) amidotransferase subunit GatA [Anaeromyxobacter diazotrophicus]|uniref:Glutamyl-tRNA(Gln) amidotransferase subunit A n=1 Tax=Anaeromyxobacter diazotrophicus TaxID=2590199 RepID=A0A7I9VM96_9BACT|nr:Asp-tRNA(Asn)/Glu-tRNA(Gln) amidotransferase subunit GatA [Anaeromyxobacter diazotrophicus]GEJ57521.1 glutamyl-tRNA(Gln) amidotransferase subunit A [Anaeromyxobacter diazotrophicus]
MSGAGELLDLSLTGLSAALAAGRVSAREATEAALARIEATDGRVGAFLAVTAERARERAAAADARAARGARLGPLDGVPLAVKDLFLTRGVATTAASRILAGFVPPYDAAVVERLEAAGAVLLGKLNLDEFAMGSSNENSAVKPCHNPWDLARTPGGSSGGSAAALAARQAFGTLGTDTGGSIREPAAFCGVVGLKPTYGRVSRYGVVAFASSLDQPGPLGRTVGDAAALLQVIAGRDARDLTSSTRPVDDYGAALEEGARGLTVGVPRAWLAEGVEAGVARRVKEALALYERLGAKLVDVELPHTKYGIAAYYLIAPAEASSNLARYDGVRFGLREGGAGGLKGMYGATRAAGFGAEPKRRIMLGTYALSAGYYDAYYLRAQKVRTLLRRDFERAFERCDVIAGPVTPAVAFRLGEKVADPLAMYLEDVFTVTCNLAALPGLSVPCGLHPEQQLPVGLQLIGRPFDEATLLRAARALEREQGPLPRPAGLEA